MEGKGIEFVCVAESEGDDKELRALRENETYGFTIYMTSVDPPDMFYPSHLPAVYVFSREGQVVFAYEGVQDWDNEACALFLEELAASDAVAP